MKIVILASRFPYPLERGDKLRLYHQLRVLSAYHEICLISLTEEDISVDARLKIDQLVSENHILKLSRFRRFISLVKASVSQLPFMMAYHFDRKAHKEINNLIDHYRPDIIYCQLTRMSEYVRHRKDAIKVLDYMDAFGVGMQRRARIVSGVAAYFYLQEAKRMIAYEQEIYPYFDAHTVISKEDQDLLQLGTNTVKVIPNGVDTDYFQPMPDVEPVYDIGFIGNLGYLPNVSAAEYLVREVVPLSDQPLKVLISGARPHPRVQQLASKGVKVQGWIDDIRMAYDQCKLIVAPIYDGTGQQNKILEAMSMGIPCITTTNVNRAIGAIPGKEIMIADDATSFNSGIIKLLENKELYNTISSNALKMVETKYSWKEMVNRLNTIFQNERNDQRN